MNKVDRSIPIIRLYGNLLIPIQFALSDPIVEQLVSDVTRAIESSAISGLILDFTGADLLDSYVTRRIRDLAVTARVMGVDTVVCGLRCAVVATLVEMGLSIPGVATALNLERALELLAARSLEAGYVPLAASSFEDPSMDAGLPPDDRGAASLDREAARAPSRLGG